MVILTVIAAEKLKNLIAEENKGTKIPETAGLRLELLDKPPNFLSIEAIPREDDLVVISQGIKFFVNPKNQEHIKEKYPKSVLVFWVAGPISSGFNIQNPNLNTNYGCGRLVNIDKEVS